jgi:hypothetical protein
MLRDRLARVVGLVPGGVRAHLREARDERAHGRAVLLPRRQDARPAGAVIGPQVLERDVRRHTGGVPRNDQPGVVHAEAEQALVGEGARLLVADADGQRGVGNGEEVAGSEHATEDAAARLLLANTHVLRPT